jgi:hypothetical protein
MGKMPNSCLVAIATKIRFKLAGPVASKLKELDTTYALATARLTELNGSDLKALALEGQRRALQQIKSARNADEIAAVSEPSKGALAAAASEQRQSLKSSLRAIAAEAVEMVRPETARFIEGAQRHLDAMLAEESARSLEYGIPHTPSPLLVELKAALGALTARHARPHHGEILKPSSLIENFATL